MKILFYKLLVFLHLMKLRTYIVRQSGNIMGGFSAVNEAHALEVYAKNLGYKSFAEVCRVLGLTREAHRLEVAQ